MKILMKIQVLLAVLLISFANCNAQTSKVERTVNELVKKYEDCRGVSCVTVVKGGGLELVKAMLKKELGKSFLKGVTGMTVIDYSDASEKTCLALRKDLDVFASMLKEFDLSKEKKFAENDYIRCFATELGPGRLSDFVIALENDKSKMAIYMAGEIIIE